MSVCVMLCMSYVYINIGQAIGRASHFLHESREKSAYPSRASASIGLGHPAHTQHGQPLPPTWSIVWLAPVSLSSNGRSAVSTSMGTPLRLASTTAGSRFATAVPLLVTSAAGPPLARP